MGWDGPHHCAACNEEVEKGVREFWAAVARGEMDADGYTPRERKLLAKRGHMPPVRRTTAPPPAVAGVNFGSLDMYAGGAAVPEGDYALEFGIQMFAGFKQTNAPMRLGVMITCHPLDGGEAKQTFLSMGTGMDKSFAPDADTGKSLVAVPGGPATTFNNSTNWALFLKSLYDCGLPQGIFSNDISVLDGIHVHTQNIPEPESRKSFGTKAATGEAALDKTEERRSGLTLVVSEIKEDGKPWEGSGGIPGSVPAAVAPKAAVKPALAKPRAVVAPVVAEVNEDDVRTAALNGISAVLEKNPNGCVKLQLRTGSFKAISETAGAEMASAVIDTFFSSDDALNGVLGDIGYVVKGQQIVVA